MYADPRPSLDTALAEVARALCASAPELARLDPDEVLIVALGAHGTSAASARGFHGVARSVIVDRRRKRYEVGLRPPFFLKATPGQRLATLAHELLHLDPEHGLAPARRHARAGARGLDADAERIAARLLAADDVAVLLPLGHHGEVLIRQWICRPIEKTHERRFTTRDLLVAPVVMHTKTSERTVWW